MEETASACRFIYNLALEQRRDFWRQARAVGVTLNYIAQNREVTELRRDLPWLAAVHSTPLTQALRDLDKAFSSFFGGRTKFPQFWSRDRRTSFRHNGPQIRFHNLDAKWARVWVPKNGWVRMRLSRPIPGRIVNATFSKDALGWHVSLACEIEHEAQPSTLPSVGIDRGVANTLALSTGELLSIPNASHLERQKRKAQRILARRRRGSNRYRKQRRHVARLSAKMARIRAHWQHEIGTEIASRFGHVALEDLKIKGMVRANRGLARSISEQSWNGFALKLAYKLEERGGTLAKVNPAYTSQECSACGVIDKRSRESQARFACRHCGFEGHADINAANNILRRSTPVVEGCGYAPDEARIGQALAA